MFFKASDFTHHLELAHKVDLLHLMQNGLLAWQRTQFLEIIDGRGLIRTLRAPYPGQSCCSNTEPTYNFTFVTL